MTFARTISALMVSIMPVAAFATDAEVTGALTPFEPAPVIATDDYNWTGPSVGLGFGFIPDATDDTNSDSEGTLYGVRLAYDYDFGQFVAGAILDIGSAELDYDTVDVDLLYRLGARAGVDAGRNWYYATAGWSRVETSGSQNLGSSDGYFFGVGYEVFLNDRMTAGAELVRSTYDDFENSATTEIDATALGLSLNFRF